MTRTLHTVRARELRAGDDIEMPGGVWCRAVALTHTPPADRTVGAQLQPAWQGAPGHSWPEDQLLRVRRLDPHLPDLARALSVLVQALGGEVYQHTGGDVVQVYARALLRSDTAKGEWLFSQRMGAPLSVMTAPAPRGTPVTYYQDLRTKATFVCPTAQFEGGDFVRLAPAPEPDLRPALVPDGQGRCVVCGAAGLVYRWSDHDLSADVVCRPCAQAACTPAEAP